MNCIRRILVSVKDPAQGVTPAASKAAQLARATGATLELFHAITTPVYLDNYTYSDWTLTDAKRDVMKRRTEQMQRIAHDLEVRPGQKCVRTLITAAWDWPAYAAIVRQAAASRADLVLVDRHAGRHLARTLMRYADWELLRLCPAPLLLVGKDSLYTRPLTLAAVDPAHYWDKSARLDERILDAATTVSTALRGTLHALHTFESTLPVSYPTDVMYPKLSRDLAPRLRTAASKRFSRLLRGRRIGQARQHLIDAPPALGIAQAARKLHADLLVMGAVSRSGLKGLLIGNTAEILLDRVTCDLLIIKPPRFKTRVARIQTGARIVPALPPVMA
ncbi:MAG TPA: universal stress protein [Steroidobacteraceae bacterium]|jgi:universal stress protein E|nr:universal stress protein [Steroidobacteraceae bacterium]